MLRSASGVWHGVIRSAHPGHIDDCDRRSGVTDYIGNQPGIAELSAPDVGIAGREGPQRIIRIFDHLGHCDDESVERRFRKAAELAEHLLLSSTRYVTAAGLVPPPAAAPNRGWPPRPGPCEPYLRSPLRDPRSSQAGWSPRRRGSRHAALPAASCSPRGRGQPPRPPDIGGGTRHVRAPEDAQGSPLDREDLPDGPAEQTRP